MKTIKVVREKILSQEKKIAPDTLRILKDYLRLADYKRGTGYFFTDNLKKECGRTGGEEEIGLRRFLQLTKYFNKQNDRIYAGSSKEDSQLVNRVQCGHYPSAMVGRVLAIKD